MASIAPAPHDQKTSPVEDLSNAQIERYARHLILDEVGEEGQLALMNAKVTVIGAGGIGSPALFYLAASGVGKIHIIDDDKVEASNLQRQILFTEEKVGQDKTQAAIHALRARNPHIHWQADTERLSQSNVLDLLAGADDKGLKPNLIIDGSDTYETRRVVAQAAYHLQIPLVSAAASQVDGQLAVFRPWLENRPCYACLFPNPPAERRSCAEVGIFAPVTGMLGTMAANQALWLLMDKPVNDQQLLMVDGQSLRFNAIKAFKRKSCEVCHAG